MYAEDKSFSNNVGTGINGTSSFLSEIYGRGFTDNWSKLVKETKLTSKIILSVIVLENNLVFRKNTKIRQIIYYNILNITQNIKYSNAKCK